MCNVVMACITYYSYVVHGCGCACVKGGIIYNDIYIIC